MSRIFNRPGRGALALIVSSLTTSAQGAGVPTLQEVTVSTRQQDLIGVADSATEGTVTARQLANRPLLRPAEVMETIPGMVVTQHSGDGKANQYFLRGFNLDHGSDFATFVAGVPGRPTDAKNEEAPARLANARGRRIQAGERTVGHP